jgi:integrase
VVDVAAAFRALSYDASRLMFGRANAALGSNWSLHDLRHSAAYRMARDPSVPLTDVQQVMGMPIGPPRSGT